MPSARGDRGGNSRGGGKPRAGLGFDRGAFRGGVNKSGRGGGDRGRGAPRGGGGGRGRGAPRGGGRGRGGKQGGGGKKMKGGQKVVVEKHRHEGVYLVKGKEDALATKNMVTGDSVYGEKRVAVQTEGEEKTEYRIWNPYRSKIASAVLNGIKSFPIKPGSKVLYLGGASGTTVSHVSDIVGPTGLVYAVEFAKRSGRDLINVAKKRTNIIPIIEDARRPERYRMLVGLVDVLFADVAQPDQARILAHNAHTFLKNDGLFMISIKANCISSTLPAPVVFAKEVEKLKEEKFKPREQITLEPYEKGHAMVIGGYRVTKKEK